MYVCFQFHVSVFVFSVTGGLHKTVRESRVPAASLLTISVSQVDCTKHRESREPATSLLTISVSRVDCTKHRKSRAPATDRPTDHFGAQLSLEELLVAGRKGRLAEVATGLCHGQGQAVLHHKLQQRPEWETSADVSGTLADHQLCSLSQREKWFSHTHTHTHFHMHVHSHTHTYTLSLTHTHSLSLSLTHTHSLSLSLTHTHTLSLSLSHTHTHTTKCTTSHMTSTHSHTTTQQYT